MTLDAVKAAAPRLGTSLAYGRLVGMTSGEVVLAFPREAALHRSSVTGVARAQIEKLLSEHLGRTTRIRTVEPSAVAGPATLSPAEEEAKQKADGEKELEARVRAHPVITAVLRVLGGEIEHVESVDPGPAEQIDAPGQTA